MYIWYAKDTEECGHEWYMDHRFSSPPNLIDDLITKKLTAVGLSD